MIKLIFIVLLAALLLGLYLYMYRSGDVYATVKQLSPVESAVELKKILDKVEATELQTIKITPHIAPVSSIQQSKFGGNPYWPKEMDQPQTRDGQPLFLLAQINFSELPALTAYPTTGMLQFFIANDDLYGLEFPDDNTTMESIINNPAGYRVVYHKEIITDESLLRDNFPVISDTDYLPLSSEYSLTFSVASEKVPPSDYRFEKVVGRINHLSDESWDKLYDELSSTGSKIGGYAHFTQDDPRGYNATEEWVLLFQMDTVSSDGVDIMWGDSGVGNFFIRPNDLQALNFDKVWYNWDCY